MKRFGNSHPCIRCVVANVYFLPARDRMMNLFCCLWLKIYLRISQDGDNKRNAADRRIHCMRTGKNNEI